MRNVLILEDKPQQLEVLASIVSEIDKKLTIYKAENVGAAYQIIGEKTIHLFIIDIILQPEKLYDVQGLEFIQAIRGHKKYEFTPIIIVTSLQDPKLYSYSKLHCYAYIEKPFKPEQIKLVVKEALNFPKQETRNQLAFFRKDGIVYVKAVKDIICIECSRREAKIHCLEEILEIPYMTCESIMRALDSDDFIQCSRYSVVNKRYIEMIDYSNRYIKMKHMSLPIEIGITMKKKFREKLEMDKR